MKHTLLVIHCINGLFLFPFNVFSLHRAASSYCIIRIRPAILCSLCKRSSSMFCVSPFHVVLPPSFQSEASPLHLLADWPWRHRKHPLSAQEEVSVIASVCLFCWFDGTPKTQLKGLQFAGYTWHWLFWALSARVQSSKYTLCQPTPQCDSYILLSGCGCTRAFQPLTAKWESDATNPSVVPQHHDLTQRCLHHRHHLESLMEYCYLPCVLIAIVDKWQHWNLSVLAVNSQARQTPVLLSSDNQNAEGREAGLTLGHCCTLQ